MARGALGLLGFWLALSSAATSALAAEAADPGQQQQLGQREIESWLSTRPGEPVNERANRELLVPPPAPRHHGLLVEGSLGAFGHLGAMKTVSPPAPRFGLQVGYEFFDWLLLFAEADLVAASTSLANPPPKPRSYTFYGFGAGLRFHLAFSERFGVQLQGSAGGAQVEEDILGVYGYKQADELSLYFGGRLGLEWYPVNPHYTVSLYGGARDYPQFERSLNSQTPLTWQAGLALAYAF